MPMSSLPLPQGTGFFAGAFYGGCVAAWHDDPISSAKRYGGIPGKTDVVGLGRTVLRPAMWFAMTGGVYTAVECAMEAARNETQDVWNTLVAGMAGGAVAGMTTGKPQLMAAAALGMGLTMVAVDLSGPKTVYDEHFVDEVKRMGMLPKQHQESEALAALKEKFKPLSMRAKTKCLI